MNWLIPIGKTLTLIAVIAAFAFVADVQAKGKPVRGGGGCDRDGISCPDVYDPVTCDNGVTYSNGCYAYVACATGCTSGGAGF